MNPLVRQKIESIRTRAVDQKAKGLAEVQLMLPRKHIAGFPRGELVAEYATHNAYAFECDKLIEWADRELANGGSSVSEPAAGEE